MFLKNTNLLVILFPTGYDTTDNFNKRQNNLKKYKHDLNRNYKENFFKHHFIGEKITSHTIHYKIIDANFFQASSTMKCQFKQTF